jgi:predicted homoserine dehydrogenase-like protein
VFVIGYSANLEDRFYMNYYKMGLGVAISSCVLTTCATSKPRSQFKESSSTRSQSFQRKRVLEVGCRAKTELQAGIKLEGICGYHVYGILEHPDDLPVGMVENTVLRNPKKRRSDLWDDVEFQNSDVRLELWKAQTDTTG